MSLNGIDDDHIMMTDEHSPVNPVSGSSDESDDHNMQLDSDIDAQNTAHDIDADGESDDELDHLPLSPPPTHPAAAVTSSSYLAKRAVSTSSALSSREKHGDSLGST